MRVLVLALVLLPSAALAQEKNPIRPLATMRNAICANAENQFTRRAAPVPAKPRSLADEPVADLYRTVLRLEDGCDKPVKIREGFGDGVEDQQ